ncbi:hypothetical protein [Micromonospora fluostatini]|uniref:hypothetical protein n=1 Tax=Micromonospora sp. JCM 30529 TaxID=3421643 RepID=UPI003D1824AC
MRAMLLVIGVVAVALVLLGLLLEAARWLILIGAVAFLVLVVLAFVRGRRTVRR